MTILSRLSLAAAFLTVCTFGAWAGTQSPPAGYTPTQMIFEDQFTTPQLDAKKWNPWLGDDRYGRWGNKGQLPAPYSGSNCNSTCSDSLQVMWYDPYPYGYSTNVAGNHLVGGNGKLQMIGTANTYYKNQGFSWASSAITSYGKAYMPAAGGYVQVHAKMPDSRNGMWASIWLLSNDGAEVDLQESGYQKGSGPVNNMLAVNWHGGGAQIVSDAGTDLSAGYHTYGVEYRPSQWFKIYLDGVLKATYTQNIPAAAAYQVLLDLEVAGPNTAGWHTVVDSSHPGPYTFEVDNVQIYSLNTTPPPPTDTTAPSAPTGLTSSLTTGYEIDLTWTASTDNVGVTGYKVLRNGTQIGTAATTTYADKTVSPGTTYSYQVQAFDAANNTSTGSNSINVTTPTYANGSAVGTTTNTSVMSRAGRGATVCAQPTNVNGTILSGPQSVNSVVWWFVGFVSGCNGWVKQTDMTLN